MATKDLIRTFLGVSAAGTPTTIAGNTTDVENVGPVIPAGKRVRLITFGAADCGTDNEASITALQWGAAGAWETIRAFGLAHCSMEVRLDQDYIGDGTKRFRVVRKNQSSSSRIVLAWLEGFVAG
jgi:hypothetical protein